MNKIMSFKRHLVLLVALAAAFGLIGSVGARVKVGGVDGPKLRERVIAHTEEEIEMAVSSGCEVVRRAKTLKALRCPAGVAASLSLAEDVRVFALDDEEVGVLRGAQPGATSASANQQIGADIVHASGNTGSGRRVAVLDTGYNYRHPELSSSYGGGRDFVNNDNDPADDQGHGSHVSGIITADGLDPKAKGVAPDAQIIAAKVLDQNGSGFFSDVVAAIYWAVDGPDGVYGTADDFGVDAINMSLGTAAPYVYKGFCNSALPDMTTAIKYAVDRNITIVAASGNSGGSGVSIPGCISYSTTVGAVDAKDKVASFSGKGGALDITAPGVGIYSTVLGSGYASWSGTSMATPMLGGVAALIKYAYPAATQTTVESKLFSTAKDLGKVGKDTSSGWGRVRANLAVQ